jgi:hypothetical protein
MHRHAACITQGQALQQVTAGAHACQHARQAATKSAQQVLLSSTRSMVCTVNHCWPQAQATRQASPMQHSTQQTRINGCRHAKTAHLSCRHAVTMRKLLFYNSALAVLHGRCSGKAHQPKVETLPNNTSGKRGALVLELGSQSYKSGTNHAQGMQHKTV